LQRRAGVELVLDRIADKARNGKRLDRDEGRFLLAEAGLLELGALAQEVRFARVPDKRVTFVIDSNPNYTNVCITDCQFCAFYRKPGDPEAWTLTVAEVLAKIEFAASKGAPAGFQVHGHDDVRPRGNPGRRGRSLGGDPRITGRARWLHGVRAVVVQARQHAAREVDQALQGPQRVPSNAGGLTSLSGQLRA